MQDQPSTPDDGRERATDSSLTFGQKLRSERESQGASIEEVAEATRIGVHHLRALEADDFGALPDDVFVKGYLRSYAEYLDADAELMIEDYTRERGQRMPAQAEGGKPDVIEEMSRILSDSEAPKRRGRSPLWLTALSLIAVLVILVAWWAVSSDTDEWQRPQPGATAAGSGSKTEARSPPTAIPAAVEASAPVVPIEKTQRRSEPRTGVVTVRAEPEPPEEPAKIARIETEPRTTEHPASPIPGPASLSVPDYGVGTAVENRQLVGESDRFTEGTDVWFWTRVRGGASGEKVHHVWLREGVEATRVSLELGGPNWRTHSRKKLWPDSAGIWAVEVRDDSGRVLARRQFVCVP